MIVYAITPVEGPGRRALQPQLDAVVKRHDRRARRHVIPAACAPLRVVRRVLRSPAMARRCFAIGVLLLAVFVGREGHADDATPVVVTMGGRARVRVQIADGRTRPCESGDNTMLFDGWLAPGETFQGASRSECICLRSTTAAFKHTGWSEPGLACRPRVCRGRVCRPAPDPTIRVVLSSE